MKRIWFLIFVLFVCLSASGCSLEYTNPNRSKAITEKKQYEEMQRQTRLMERQTEALERIADAIEKRGE